MEWYAKAGRQTKPSSYQHSHNRLDEDWYANREWTPVNASHTHIHAHGNSNRPTNRTLYTYSLRLGHPLWYRVRNLLLLVEIEKMVVKAQKQENGSWGQKTVPPPSPPLKSAYVVTNDTFIFLQRLCICKTAEVHQDVKYFGWPPRLLWKITRWKYNCSAEDVESLSFALSLSVLVFHKPVQ